MTQLQIAELFQTTKQNVSLHAQDTFGDGELTSDSTVKESFTVQTEGRRQVKRTITYYNLDLILAIGYRVPLTDRGYCPHIERAQALRKRLGDGVTGR